MDILSLQFRKFNKKEIMYTHALICSNNFIKSQKYVMFTAREKYTEKKKNIKVRQKKIKESKTDDSQ